MQIKVLKHNTWGVPEYATDGAAALDLRACIREPVYIPGGNTEMIPAGISVHIGDKNVGGLIIPRSGAGANRGMVLGNGTGLIDSDYQGEIHVPMLIRGAGGVTIMPGERIAQLFFVPLVHPTFTVVKDFYEETTRGTGGFGHTGDI